MGQEHEGDPFRIFAGGLEQHVAEVQDQQQELQLLTNSNTKYMNCKNLIGN